MDNKELEALKDIADAYWNKAQQTRRLLKDNDELSADERKLLEDYAKDCEADGQRASDEYNNRFSLCPECLTEVDLNYGTLCDKCLESYNLYSGGKITIKIFEKTSVVKYLR